MRSAFVNGLIEIAARDERTVLLTGDLGFNVFEPFAERFPDRFLNAGVAEQNMIGMATGLAEAGLIPYVYSIATFASMRGYEFVRNGPILHDLPVRVVGVGGGIDYGHNGMTHYAIEDVGIMRVQPGITTIAPADPLQTRTALEAAHALPGPVYLRLGKGSSGVPGLDGRFELGRLELVGDGEDVALIALGGMAGEAIEAAQLLREQGVGATVALVTSFNPRPPTTSASCSRACRWRSRSRPTTSTAASARSPPRRSPSAASPAASCAPACRRRRSAPAASATTSTTSSGSPRHVSRRPSASSSPHAPDRGGPERDGGRPTT